MKRIGVLGGTFDPIHSSHIVLASMALSRFLLDEVWFMPSKNPPHKQGKRVTADEDRLAMLEAALKDYKSFKVSDYEMKREGLTYSSDTFAMLKKDLCDCRFFLIIGGDSLMHLEDWHEPESLFSNVELIAASRAGMPDDEAIEQILKLEKKYGARIQYLKAPAMEISSTQIRIKASLNMCITGLVPKAVEDYILEKHLYEDKEICELKAILKQELKEKRYIHTLGVAATASELAARNGVDVRKAYLAGILHDNAKSIDYDDQLACALSHGLELTDIEKRKPGALVHSKLGAHFAKERFKVTDEDVLNSITYHTTGRPAMSTLEKIIFVADYIEPMRDMEINPSICELRAIALKDLDLAVFYELRALNDYLKENEEDIDQCSIETMKYYDELIHNRAANDGLLSCMSIIF